MVNEILGFREPVITQRQEALPTSAAPRHGTAQPFVSQLYGEAFAAPPLYPHDKCANENLPKSEYGSLLKGCRRSTNWNLKTTIL